MKRYHVNEKGQVNVCEAEPGFCPLSTIDGHYSTQEDTQKFYENFMERLQNKNDTVKFHFMNGSERHVFTKSDCVHFAKALNKVSGLPVYYLGDHETANKKSQDKKWAHFINKLPDGRYIDVEGIWTEKDLLKRWDIDELGSGWKPNSIHLAELTELRKMGVESQKFPEVKPNKTITKLKKNIQPIVNFDK